MLGSGPITGAPLASSFGEIIVVSLDHGSFTATGQAINIGLSLPADNGSFTLTGQEIRCLLQVKESRLRMR